MNNFEIEKDAELDRISIYIDANNNDNLWGKLHYSVNRRSRIVRKEKIIKFNDYNEMISFVNEYFDEKELTGEIPTLYRRVHLHFIDYSYIKHMVIDNDPSANYLEIGITEHKNGQLIPDKLTFKPRYEKMFVEFLRKNRKIPDYFVIGPEFYQKIDVNKDARIHNNPNFVTKKREDIKKERIKMTVPEAPKKEKHPIKRFVASALALAALFTAYRGFKLVHSRSYTGDGINLDQIEDYGDYLLLYDKEYTGNIITKLVKEDYQNISEDDINHFISYLDDIIKSNHDNNKSFNQIKFSEFTYDVIVTKETKDIFDKLDAKYAKCFKREYRHDGEYTFNEEGAKEFLDYALPLVLMNNGHYRNLFSGFVETRLDTYNENYPTTEEVKAYGELPKVFHVMLDDYVVSILSHVNDYNFRYPHYVSGGTDKDSLSQKIVEIFFQDKANMFDLQQKAFITSSTK